MCDLVAVIPIFLLPCLHFGNRICPCYWLWWGGWGQISARRHFRSRHDLFYDRISRARDFKAIFFPERNLGANFITFGFYFLQIRWVSQNFRFSPFRMCFVVWVDVLVRLLCPKRTIITKILMVYFAFMFAVFFVKNAFFGFLTFFSIKL